jgi:hypothetical protein
MRGFSSLDSKQIKKTKIEKFRGELNWEKC